MLKCASLLLKEGLSLQDKTEEGQKTPLFVAIMSHNQVFAKWLIEKDASAIQGKIENQKLNILHMLSKEFYFYDSTILFRLVKSN